MSKINKFNLGYARGRRDASKALRAENEKLRADREFYVRLLYIAVEKLHKTTTQGARDE